MRPAVLRTRARHALAVCASILASPLLAQGVPVIDGEQHVVGRAWPAGWGPRPLVEVVDGGYGWGSAAPVWDGAMPLGHPVKANKQWMKFQEPADGWYDKMHADV